MGIDMAELRRRYKGTRFHVDRHGNHCWYTLDPRGKKVRMREEVGTDAWVAEWKRIREGIQSTGLLPKAGTLAAVIRAYRRSPEFAELRASTRAVRVRILDSIKDSAGDLPADGITPADIRAGRDARRSTPAAANNRMKALSALYSWAIEEGLVSTNPVQGVKRLKEAKGGHHTWTVDECLQFEAYHPTGSTARLVYALALYTASRRSDLSKLGHQHVTRDGFLRIEQEKTDSVVILPIVPPLAAEIAQAPRGFTFILNSHGNPFSVAGLGNKMREWCDAAGLPDCSLHGLRKATAARLAEHGVSANGIAAVTGHKTLSEVQRYTSEADQKRLAKASLEGAFGEQNRLLDLPTANINRPPMEKSQ